MKRFPGEHDDIRAGRNGVVEQVAKAAGRRAWKKLERHRRKSGNRAKELFARKQGWSE